MQKNITRCILATFFFAIVFAGAVVFYSSCKKNKNSDVTITVMNGTSNVPVASASVHMYPPPSAPPPQGSSNLAEQDQTGITDAAGTVSFTFKFPAILQADVTPPLLSGLGPGSALVKLEEGKQVSKTIKIY